MGYRSRNQVSAKFLSGAPPYSPEFKAAMIAVMADPAACLSERLYTLARFFAWGNASHKAVSHWDQKKARALDQTDVRLILGCLEAGTEISELTGEALDAMRLHPERRPKCMKSKQEISRAMGRNEARGTIRCKGREIFAEPEPQPAEREKSSNMMTFRRDAAYLATVDPAKLERLAEAEKTAKDICRELRAGYREFQKSSHLMTSDLADESQKSSYVMTFDPPEPKPEVAQSDDSNQPESATSARPDLITEEVSKKISSSSKQQPPATTTTGTRNGHARHVAPVAAEQNSAVIDTCPDTVSTAIAEEYAAVDQAHLDNIWRDCCQTTTPAELAELVRMEAPVAQAKKNKPGNGLLRATLANAARTPAKLAEARRRIAVRAAQPPPLPPRLTKDVIAEVLNDPDFTESKKRELLGEDYAG
jgi:hypothetical protein